MGIFLRNVDNLRAVEWSSSWTWDIQFDGAPAPFDQWFPATEVQETIGIVNTMDFESVFINFSVPQKSGAKELQISFVDDASLILEGWFDHWINKEIFGRTNEKDYIISYVRPIKDIVKRVNIVKLTKQNKAVAMSSYLVFPKDAYTFSGNSDAGMNTNEITFVVAGTQTMAHYKYRNANAEEFVL